MNNLTTKNQRKNQSGWVMMWFLLMAPLVLVMIGGIIDMARVYIIKQSMQHVVDTTALQATYFERKALHDQLQVPIPDVEESTQQAKTLCKQNIAQHLQPWLTRFDRIDPTCDVDFESHKVQMYWISKDAGDYEFKDYKSAVRLTANVQLFTLGPLAQLFDIPVQTIVAEAKAIPFYELEK